MVVSKVTSFFQRESAHDACTISSAEPPTVAAEFRSRPTSRARDDAHFDADASEREYVLLHERLAVVGERVRREEDAHVSSEKEGALARAARQSSGAVRGEPHPPPPRLR